SLACPAPVITLYAWNTPPSIHPKQNGTKISKFASWTARGSNRSVVLKPSRDAETNVVAKFAGLVRRPKAHTGVARVGEPAPSLDNPFSAVDAIGRIGAPGALRCIP